MPTAARLFAALGFALMAFFASEIVKPLLPEGTQVGRLTMVNTIIGMMCGWLVMGRLAGRGYVSAAGSGLRTAAVILFYVLILWSLLEMLKRSMRKLYDGPMEAIKAMAELMGEYASVLVADPQMPIVLIAGGILAAFFSEWASQRFN